MYAHTHIYSGADLQLYFVRLSRASCGCNFERIVTVNSTLKFQAHFPKLFGLISNSSLSFVLYLIPPFSSCLMWSIDITSKENMGNEI